MRGVLKYQVLAFDVSKPFDGDNFSFVEHRCCVQAYF